MRKQFNVLYYIYIIYNFFKININYKLFICFYNLKECNCNKTHNFMFCKKN